VESYRTFMSYWTGNPPASEMALVVHRAAGSGAFTAYVSWNGATEIHTWRISAGKSDSTLKPVATAPKGSFESTVPFTASGATVFEATAYASNGRALGRSKIVAAT
jgi:hypothetical protein